MAAIDLNQWGVHQGVKQKDASRQLAACAEGRVLLIEDEPAEAELTIRELRKSGLSFSWRRVQSEMDLRRSLSEFHPTLILSDFTMPQFDGMEALQLSRALAPQTPFIFVSGSIGEERAIDALQKGAADYVLKTNLARLAPAVGRALRIDVREAGSPQPALEHRLRTAAALQQFELHYQPKVCVRTRRIEGVEALLRWRAPDTGLMHPGDFLPLLESSGLIHEVGDWILERAVQDCRFWQQLGLPAVRVALNISAVQLRRPDFAHRFLLLTRPRTGHVVNLDIEITANALMGDASRDLKKLQVLRAAGVQVAIDDFGSGLSPLDRLAQLPIDCLKIDKSFVGGLPADRSSHAMVSALLSLARGLKLQVVAEGVETNRQLEALRQLGCDQSQGYLHSQVVTREELAQLLRHGKGWLMLPPEPSGYARAGNAHNSSRINAI
jgi:EAL domain-containing protein (putative c-di-GMP-specific phosphodiesterase class I)